MTMNRDYYSSLSEAYQAMYEDDDVKKGERAGKNVDASGAIRGAQKAGKELKTAGTAYGKGFFQGKEINPNARPHLRAANAVGRAGQVAGRTAAGVASNVAKGAGKVYDAGKSLGDAKGKLLKTMYGFAKGAADTTKKGLKKEEIEALLNSPHLTEEEREAFIALIDEERKDEAGMSPDEKSIGRSIKAGMNPATDHMAAATRQRLHLSQRGKKKSAAHSKETRLPAQQLKARKANDGVKEMGEEAILSTLMDDLLDENRLTPAALEAAAAANQKRDKARGMKIHSTQGVKDLFNIKPGKV